MARPRIIIADTDFNYIVPLQLKLVEEFFEKLFSVYKHKQGIIVAKKGKTNFLLRTLRGISE